MDFSSANSYWRYVRDGDGNDYDDDGYSDDDND